MTLLLRIIYIDYNGDKNYIMRRGLIMKKKYGVGKLILDLLLISFTGGLWLLVILVKFLRS